MKFRLYMPIGELEKQHMKIRTIIGQMYLSGHTFCGTTDEEVDGTLTFTKITDADDASCSIFFLTLENKYGKFLCEATITSYPLLMQWIDECFVEPKGLGASLYVLYGYERGFAMLCSDKRGLTFPGGKIEEGETPEAACVREVMEETGMIAKIHPKATFQMMCGTCLCHVHVCVEFDDAKLPNEFGPSPEFEHEGKGIWNPYTLPSKFCGFNERVYQTVLSMAGVWEFINEHGIKTAD